MDIVRSIVYGCFGMPNGREARRGKMPLVHQAKADKPTPAKDAVIM